MGCARLAPGTRTEADAEGTALERGIAVMRWAAFEATWGNVDDARSMQDLAERNLERFSRTHPGHGHIEALVAATATRIAIADGDLGAAREQAARSYRAGVGSRDMSVLATVSAVTAELAFAAGQPERAARTLGARVAVRGAEDPTDPTETRLAPVLRAAIGDAGYEAARAAGKALDRQAAIEALDPAGPTC